MTNVGFVRFLAVALMSFSALADAGCASHSSSGPPPPPAPLAPTESAGTCSAGYVAGLIAGDPKCLQNGQQCQIKFASDYEKDGFSCTKVGHKYQLKGIS